MPGPVAAGVAAAAAADASGSGGGSGSGGVGLGGGQLLPVVERTGMSSRYRPWVETGGATRVYSVPYSEHSSFDEICEFVKVCKPRTLIPTVNADTRQETEKYCYYYDNSCNLRRRKHGEWYCYYDYKSLLGLLAPFLDLSRDRSRIHFYLPTSAAAAGTPAAEPAVTPALTPVGAPAKPAEPNAGADGAKGQSGAVPAGQCPLPVPAVAPGQLQTAEAGQPEQGGSSALQEGAGVLTFWAEDGNGSGHFESVDVKEQQRAERFYAAQASTQTAQAKAAAAKASLGGRLGSSLALARSPGAGGGNGGGGGSGSGDKGGDKGGGASRAEATGLRPFPLRCVAYVHSFDGVAFKDKARLEGALCELGARLLKKLPARAKEGMV
ncbi:hypothetical protein T492DRAFT_842231 [Pavlovales sp. CCMP2436]|nr:hypothetical protein T492DRAFT_842231 [Pavlovales sp. CCMP2436]